MAIMRSIQNYHIDSLGWPDIGYNYLVGEDGRAYEGRGWDAEGAHTYGYNSDAVAVSCIGDFSNVEPNAAAQAAIQNTFACAVQQGFLTSTYEMFGHRDGGCTACPGDALYARIQTWPQYSFRTIPVYCKADGTADY
jgi:N-acetylmuramoyl-L-alanine amidase